MSISNLTVTLKRLAIAAMAIALLITSSLLIMKPSPRQGDTALNGGNSVDTDTAPTAAQQRPAQTTDHLASVAVVILNSGKDLPLAIKANNKLIEIPGPSSWPANGAAGTESGRFLAGIIDTADVLKANGLKPDDTYSFVVGGTALNASNTFQVLGNHQPDPAQANTDGFSEEIHSNPDEEGIWRSLKFKNIVLSYGQIPTLADFLVGKPSRPTATAMTNDTTTLNDQSALEDTTLKSEKDVEQYREDLNSSYPDVRAKAIQNLMLFSNPLNKDPSHPDAKTYLEQALTDTDPTVREAALSSLDLWDGDIPMEMLSKIVLNDQDPDIRIHALGVLADRFDERAVPTLQQASHDPDSRVAQKASQLLQAYSQ